MKILELHLRNIASIEKVDIDFENDPGLIDPDTGKAAQMFLIYGDTGTGKSILLDGISMALFDQTPRIKSIENRVKNSFTDAYGNETQITSIEQYSRMGINENDECYSEVVFVGNDGVNYRAKMELGMTRLQKGKNKGRLVSQKRWKLKIGDADWTENECGPRIEAAIGMNYDQFCRMAMLAQGMFSNFLCGDRKQRADILERLTQTENFSNYGIAIKNIYDRKKSIAETAKGILHTVKQFPLPPDEVQRLQTVMDEEEGKIKAASEKKRTLQETINLVDKITSASQRHDDAQQKLQQLQEVSLSEDFRKMKELCSDWDNTDSERKTLSMLQMAQSTLSNAQKQLEAQRKKFALLAADLMFRKNKHRSDAIKMDNESSWIEQRKQREQLYLSAQATIAALEQYSKDKSNAALMLSEIENAKKQTPQLQKALDETNREINGLTKEIEDKKSFINDLTTERNKLDAGLLDKEVHQLSLLAQAYRKLKDDFDKWNQDKEELKKLTQQHDELKTKLLAALSLREEAQKNAQSANTEYEDATRRWTTINASLDDKLDDLRKKISEGDADICPLCGQKIAGTILTKEQFASIVTPYETERQRAKTKADEAQKQLTQAASNVSNIEGEMKTLQKQADTLSQNIDTSAISLKDRMRKAGIDPEANIESAINQNLASIDEKSKALQDKKDRLASLQKSIDEKQTEKEPLEEKKNKASALLASLNEKFKQNKGLIDQLTLKADKADKELEDNSKKLDNSLNAFFPEWANDIDSTIRNLGKEAEEYLYHKNLCQQMRTSLEKQEELNRSLDHISNQIAAQFPDWTAATDCTTSFDSPLIEWNDLSAQSSALFSTISNCRKTISECTETLAKWQEISGKDTEYLVALSKRNDEVALSRKNIAEHEGNIKSLNDTLSEAIETIAHNRKCLNLDDSAPVPDRDELNRELIACEAQEKESTALYSEAHTKLESDKLANKKLEEQQAIYDKAKKDYDHWDILNRRFGGERFRNLVQTHILLPLLNNANIYLRQITERYTLTCSSDNEQLSILVLDRFNRNEVRSAAVLSGGEKFMISLALSLALSSLNRPDMNVNILFIDEGFGTLDQECLNSVMTTLGRLGEMSGQAQRRVGIISHREELLGCIPNKIKLKRIGEGRSKVEVVYEP